MKPKIKLIYSGPIWILRNWRAKKIAKKIKKYNDEERYSMQWRNDYILNRGKKFLKFLNVELEIIGYDNIPKSTSLFIANHFSSVDPTILVVAMKNPGQATDDINPMSVFLAKKELEKSKRFSGYMDILNTFYLDRENPRQTLQILNDIASHAKENRKHIVIFPEGTRSKDGRIQEFKNGAFRIAKKAFIPIIPITINNSFSAANLDREKKLKVQIIFHNPIKPLSIISMSHSDIAKKVKTIIEEKIKNSKETPLIKEPKLV